MAYLLAVKYSLNYWRYYIILVLLARKGGKYAEKA